MFDRVVDHFTRPTDAGDRRMLAQALFFRGRAYVSVNAARDLDRAEADLRRAYDLYTATSTEFQATDCLGQLGVVYAGRYDESIRRGSPRGPVNPLYREAKRLWLETRQRLTSQQPTELSSTLTNLGQLCILGGEVTEARDCYEQALTLADSLHDGVEGARAAYGLALAMAGLLGGDSARVYAEDALARADTIGARGAEHREKSLALLREHDGRAGRRPRQG